MQDNRNAPLGLGCDNHGTVCIDTKRVLDCCRDRDCFEDVRVYLTAYGEEIISSTSNIRTKSAKLIWAYVGVDAVPFNNGFYQITVRYYIKIDFEACIALGKNTQCFSGIAVLEKNVILYGGEGGVVSYSSSTNGSFCDMGETTMATNDPIAVVETVEPIVLGTKIIDCSCGCGCCSNDCCELPAPVCGCIDGELIVGNGENTQKLYVSLGIFSVIRIERQAQLLIQATDYSVPDKECQNSRDNDNPCSLFNTMPFPVNQFKTTTTQNVELQQRSGNCGCNNR